MRCVTVSREPAELSSTGTGGLPHFIDFRYGITANCTEMLSQLFGWTAPASRSRACKSLAICAYPAAFGWTVSDFSARCLRT